MRVNILLVMLCCSVLCTVGCSLIRHSSDEYTLCSTDPVCSAKMASNQQIVKNLTMGLPFGNEPLANVMGGLAVLLTGLIGGHKLAQKRLSQNSVGSSTGSTSS